MHYYGQPSPAELGYCYSLGYWGVPVDLIPLPRGFTGAIVLFGIRQRFQAVRSLSGETDIVQPRDEPRRHVYANRVVGRKSGV